MPIDPEADVGDNLFTSMGTAFDRRAAKMGQGDDIGQGNQPRIDLRFTREHIQTCSGDLTVLQRCNQSFLVNQISACGVDQVGCWLHGSEPRGIHHMVRFRPGGAVQGQHVSFGKQAIKVGLVTHTKHRFHAGRQLVTVVVDHFHPERACAVGHRLTNSAHAHDPQPLAADAMAKHRRWGPAGPFAVADQAAAFAQTAWDRQDQHHGEVSGIVGENPGGIGHNNLAAARGSQIDVFDPRAEVGNQAKSSARRFKHSCINPVGYRGNKNVGIGHRRDHFVAGQWAVLNIQDHIEQLCHSGFDRGQQVPGHMDARLAFDPAGQLGVGYNGHGQIARPGRGKWSSGLKRIGQARYQRLMIMTRRLFPVLAFLSLTVPALAQDAAKTPYWASVRSEEVNMRVGPGEDYRIVWVYKRPLLPLKVLRMKEGWRYVQDPGGARGWVLGSLLARKRGGYIQGKEPAEMREGAGAGSKLLWRLAPGVIGELGDCKNGWCGFAVGPRKGFVPQERIWGAGEP